MPVNVACSSAELGGFSFRSITNVTSLLRFALQPTYAATKLATFPRAPQATYVQDHTTESLSLPPLRRPVGVVLRDTPTAAAAPLY